MSFTGIHPDNCPCEKCAPQKIAFDTQAVDGMTPARLKEIFLRKASEHESGDLALEWVQAYKVLCETEQLDKPKPDIAPPELVTKDQVYDTTIRALEAVEQIMLEESFIGTDGRQCELVTVRALLGRLKRVRGVATMHSRYSNAEEIVFGMLMRYWKLDAY